MRSRVFLHVVSLPLCLYLHDRRDIHSPSFNLRYSYINRPFITLFSDSVISAGPRYVLRRAGNFVL